MAFSILTQLLAKAYQSGYRSNILNSLIYICAVIITAIAVLSKTSVDKWIINGLAVTLFIVIAVFVFSYLYCVVKDRDALRSERYSINKMAIENKFFGDDKSGPLSNEIISSVIPIEKLSDDSEMKGGTNA
jgi:hypothetical protein